MLLFMGMAPLPWLNPQDEAVQQQADHAGGRLGVVDEHASR